MKRYEFIAFALVVALCTTLRAESQWGSTPPGQVDSAASFAALDSVPPAPALVLPAAGAFIDGETVAVTWHPSPGASSYRIQVAGDPSMSSLSLDTTVVDTSAQISLAYMRGCYWRVQAINVVGPGPFSDLRVFYVMRSPVLVSPHFGATHLVPGTALTWRPAPGATGYRITVALDGTFAGSAVVVDTTLVDTSRTTFALHPNASYFWRVRVRYNDKDGPFSETWTFDTRTIGTTEIFPLRKRSEFAYDYSRSYYYAEFGRKDWDLDTGTVSYAVMDATYPNDSTVIWSVQENTRLLHHHWSVNALGTILYDSTYWLNSTSSVSLTESLIGEHELLCQSRVWSFPQLPGPTPGAQWSGREPVYRFWADTSRTLKQYQQPPDPDRYQILHFAEYRGLADRTYFFHLGGNHVISVGEVATRKVYFTGVPEPMLPTRPQAAILMQNYPNPFNPSTAIRYGLPARSHVTLAIFNTLGQQVAVLQDGEQAAGYHEVQFDAHSLPTGMYLYRLSAGDFVDTRRLLLVR